MQRAPQKDARAPRSLIASYFFMYHPLRLLPPLGFRTAPDRCPSRCSLRAVPFSRIVAASVVISGGLVGLDYGHREIKNHLERRDELVTPSLRPPLAVLR